VDLAVNKYLGDAFKIFLSEFIPDDEVKFAAAMKKFKLRKYRNLRKTMNDEQWCVLLLSSSVFKLDISMMIKVARNFNPRKDAGIDLDIPKPQGGWFVKSPHDDDNSKSAWCLRLVILRNKVIHSPLDAFNDETSFNNIMVEIEEVLKGFESSLEVLQAFHQMARYREGYQNR